MKARWVTVSVLLLAAAVAVLALFVGFPKRKSVAAKAAYDFRPVLINRCYQTLLEKPDASRVLLVGEPATSCRTIFEDAGVRTFRTCREGDRFDIVVFGCEEITRESLRKVLALLPENGVVAWFLDVRGIASEDLYNRFVSFDCPVAHLWMSGEDQWLLVGRKEPRRIKLASMLELLAREKGFEQLARMRDGTLPNMLAGYVGTLEEILPAFETRQRTDAIFAGHYIPKDVRPIGWIASDGVDEDISRRVLADVRSFQLVRRQVVEGNQLAMSATDAKSAEKATEAWSRAFLRNPGDLFLLERLDRLERNARGFLEVGKMLQAMKCYETIGLVNPTDARILHNFGVCLRKLGKKDLSEKILNRAKMIEEAKKQAETNNFEFEK